ncbi:MAG: transcription antitermination factor NusB [Halanaerobiales bacterium]|nr:transcription antitermination factor NusB [Halanaerobiales bacterium]
MVKLKRRQQRIWALQILFEIDFQGIPIEEAIANLENREPDAVNANYTKKLISFVEEHLDEINAKIEQYSKDWRIDRMSRVDASILRMAAAEMLYIDEVVDSIAINEAIEIAKEFSSHKSSKFINGILGALSTRV